MPFNIEDAKIIVKLCDLGLRTGGLESVNECAPLAAKAMAFIRSEMQKKDEPAENIPPETKE